MGVNISPSSGKKYLIDPEMLRDFFWHLFHIKKAFLEKLTPTNLKPEVSVQTETVISQYRSNFTDQVSKRKY